MARKIFYDIRDEYQFLKGKVIKLYGELQKVEKQHLKKAKIIKKGKGFIERMYEIERMCRDYGLPHPDAGAGTKEITREDLTELKYKTRGAINPDGTLFKTPPMPGSDPRFYSTAEEQEDYILKTED
jgi:hypothetical protein